MKYTTGKRQKIIDFLTEKRENAYTLEEISAALTEDGKGKSTVYRLISELVGEGKITRISDGRTRRITYQYVGAESCHSHLHLKCKGCGKLVHLDEELSQKLGQALLSVGGFFLDEGAFLFGTCKKCAEVGA